MPRRRRNPRTRELATIHCLARDLALDHDTYILMCRQVAGADSAADLDAVGRRALIAHMRSKLGARDNRGDAAVPHNLANKPALRKIGALLCEADRPWAYGDALARRICKRARLAFCSDADLAKVIAALSYDQLRRRRRAHGENHG